ncbi:MAG TPA: TRL-like family protein [Thermoanaerobaculia bacterium]|nr:TRL-like family protein [Thermoanaerobaculia bacterium]HUM29214.1 TRL-like family protein [Thermoanaerobaculia bacterium]HXK67827.1 TRL-like family protein [Thermoanaerobaculia bacterium]
MKLRALFLLALLFSLSLLISCAYGVAPVTGVVYTDVKAPVSATANDVQGTLKTGESTCESFLGLIAVGDCSIDAAAKKAGITAIHHVDYETKGFLGLYTRFTVFVYGE